MDYTPGGGTPRTLAYSKDCADANGWHYDSTIMPMQILMCSGICSALATDKTGGKIDIVFACTTPSGDAGGGLPR